MVEFATQYEVDNFRDFELKLITPLDALEFAEAQNEFKATSKDLSACCRATKALVGQTQPWV